MKPRQRASNPPPLPKVRTIRLTIANRARVRLPAAGDFARVLSYAIKRQRIRRKMAVSLAVVRDPEMRQLNARFRDKRRTTDVLAFADGGIDPETGWTSLGDVAIGYDRARVESKRRGTSVRFELLLYALHGLLHLLGYRDHTPAARRVMEREQRAVLRRLGIRIRIHG